MEGIILMVSGKIQIKEFLERTEGKVRGNVVTDAKTRSYIETPLRDLVARSDLPAVPSP
jgi:hypothetical protein